MAAEAAKKKNKKNGKSQAMENDIFTALLGVTVLVLGATVIVVCMRSMALFESIF